MQINRFLMTCAWAGQLTEAVRRRPYAVIVLDEVRPSPVVLWVLNHATDPMSCRSDRKSA